MSRKRRIGMLTGGGDCPGINAFIRAVAKRAIQQHGMEVFGIEDGYDRLIHRRHRRLGYDDVSGILTLGGTILGASKISNSYQDAVRRGHGRSRPVHAALCHQEMQMRVEIDPVAKCLDGRDHSWHKVGPGDSLEITGQRPEGQAAEFLQELPVILEEEAQDLIAAIEIALDHLSGGEIDRDLQDKRKEAEFLIRLPPRAASTGRSVRPRQGQGLADKPDAVPIAKGGPPISGIKNVR